jgi:hypothetical protein
LSLLKDVIFNKDNPLNRFPETPVFTGVTIKIVIPAPCRNLIKSETPVFTGVTIKIVIPALCRNLIKSETPVFTGVTTFENRSGILPDSSPLF